MEKDYYIVIDGEKVPVTEEVYRAFKQPAWKERKRREVRVEKERSLDVFFGAGYDIPSEQALVDEIVADKLLLDELYSALSELTDDERKLIDALFYKEKSERTFAKEIGISSIAVHKRKHKVLDKLKNILKF